MVELPTRNQQIEEILQQYVVIPRTLDHIAEKWSTEISSFPDIFDTARISYQNSFLTLYEPPFDATGKPLEILTTQYTETVLLLVDPLPNANWSHVCWIATFTADATDEQIIAILNDFPPKEYQERRLVPTSSELLLASSQDSW